ncbi:MAG TPA: efflux RND transporter periplasmic adaptor subunit, partial [Bacteroidota bacterium]|nr:efflux RND transporter periplasmic adaptor subunit [Bacteroidota bacterium]
AISAQREYLLAVNSFEEVKEQTESIASGARALLDQSKEKLMQWGFSKGQIDQLDSTKQAQNFVAIYSPIGGTVIEKNVEPQQYVGAGDNLFDVADVSTVWITADIYQNEAELIHVGQTMTASIEGYPLKEISGRITFISPTVDPATRTIRVRSEFPNPHNALKINMYADVTITTEAASSIVIPTSAILSTGHGKIVWIQKDPNVFEPRAVVTGEQSGGFVQILKGIDENDIVVSSGGYLLDSESQLETPDESSHDQTR